MITVYGIPNCDTVKRARTWLDTQGIAYEFHDFRKQGLDEKHLKAWLKEVDWQKLLNTRGTTWRQLPEAERADPDRDKAIALMLAHPTLVKRPVVTGADSLLVGFDEAAWKAGFEK